MKFENGDELGESGPMELAQLADEMGASSLFDHGVVGSLAKTYDSSLLYMFPLITYILNSLFLNMCCVTFLNVRIVSVIIMMST